MANRDFNCIKGTERILVFNDIRPLSPVPSTPKTCFDDNVGQLEDPNCLGKTKSNKNDKSSSNNNNNNNIDEDFFFSMDFLSLCAGDDCCAQELPEFSKQQLTCIESLFHELCNEKGLIGVKELRGLLEKYCYCPSPDVIRKVIKISDIDKDSKLNLSEFVLMWRLTSMGAMPESSGLPHIMEMLQLQIGCGPKPSKRASRTSKTDKKNWSRCKKRERERDRKKCYPARSVCEKGGCQVASACQVRRDAHPPCTPESVPSPHQNKSKKDRPCDCQCNKEQESSDEMDSCPKHNEKQKNNQSCNCENHKNNSHQHDNGQHEKPCGHKKQQEETCKHTARRNTRKPECECEKKSPCGSKKRQDVEDNNGCQCGCQKQQRSPSSHQQQQSNHQKQSCSCNGHNHHKNSNRRSHSTSEKSQECNCSKNKNNNCNHNNNNHDNNNHDNNNHNNNNHNNNNHNHNNHNNNGNNNCNQCNKQHRQHSRQHHGSKDCTCGNRKEKTQIQPCDEDDDNTENDDNNENQYSPTCGSPCHKKGNNECQKRDSCKQRGGMSPSRKVQACNVKKGWIHDMDHPNPCVMETQTFRDKCKGCPTGMCGMPKKNHGRNKCCRSDREQPCGTFEQCMYRDSCAPDQGMIVCKPCCGNRLACEITEDAKVDFDCSKEPDSCGQEMAGLNFPNVKEMAEEIDRRVAESATSSDCNPTSGDKHKSATSRLPARRKPQNNECNGHDLFGRQRSNPNGQFGNNSNRRRGQSQDPLSRSNGINSPSSNRSRQEHMSSNTTSRMKSPKFYLDNDLPVGNNYDQQSGSNTNSDYYKQPRSHGGRSCKPANEKSCPEVKCPMIDSNSDDDDCGDEVNECPPTDNRDYFYEVWEEQKRLMTKPGLQTITLECSFKDGDAKKGKKKNRPKIKKPAECISENDDNECEDENTVPACTPDPPCQNSESKDMNSQCSSETSIVSQNCKTTSGRNSNRNKAGLNSNNACNSNNSMSSPYPLFSKEKMESRGIRVSSTTQLRRSRTPTPREYEIEVARKMKEKKVPKCAS